MDDSRPDDGLSDPRIREWSGGEALDVLDLEHSEVAEVYGFVGWLGTIAAYLCFLLWAFLPEDVMRSVGVTYYPDRWWALAIPAWLVMCIFCVFWGYVGLNLLRTPDLGSFDTLTDPMARRLSGVSQWRDTLAEGTPSFSDMPLVVANRLMFPPPGFRVAPSGHVVPVGEEGMEDGGEMRMRIRSESVQEQRRNVGVLKRTASTPAISRLSGTGFLSSSTGLHPNIPPPNSPSSSRASNIPEESPTSTSTSPALPPSRPVPHHMPPKLRLPTVRRSNDSPPPATPAAFWAPPRLPRVPRADSGVDPSSTLRKPSATHLLASPQQNDHQDEEEEDDDPAHSVVSDAGARFTTPARRPRTKSAAAAVETDVDVDTSLFRPSAHMTRPTRTKTQVSEEIFHNPARRKRAKTESDSDINPPQK